MFDNTENGTIIEDVNNVEVIPSEIRNSEGTGITMIPNECDINDMSDGRRIGVRFFYVILEYV